MPTPVDAIKGGSVSRGADIMIGSSDLDTSDSSVIGAIG
jgi:hypothetical protein